MRVATIYWNENTDVTKIKFSQDFLLSHRIVHLDVLKDSRFDLNRYYNSMLDEFKHLNLVDIVSMPEEVWLKAARKAGPHEVSEEHKNWKDVNDAYEAGCEDGREYQRKLQQEKLGESHE